VTAASSSNHSCFILGIFIYSCREKVDRKVTAASFVWLV